MAEHDFTDLYAQYPAIIAQMPETFTSHQFILELAHHNQTLYIEALYSYRNIKHRDVPAPFLYVHRILAQQLSNLPQLVQKVQESVPSTDIFKQSNRCTEWRKFT